MQKKGPPKKEWPFGGSVPDNLSERRAVGTRLFSANDCTTVHLIRRDNSDLWVPTCSGRQNVLFRGELVRGEPLVKDDEVLTPQGVESLALDGIDHRNKVLFIVEIIGRIDLVDVPVVCDRRRRCTLRHLLHVDGEQITIVQRGCLACRTIGAG